MTLNVSAENDLTRARGWEKCQTNKWEYNGEQREVGRLAPLAPGAFLETLLITTSTCNDRTSVPIRLVAFTIGVEGASQFKFTLQEKADKYGLLTLSEIDWGFGWGLENYTGGGSTHGLVQYNAGNGAVLGSGNPGVTDEFRYSQGQAIYFSMCPQAAGNKKVKAIPSSCRR